MSARALWKAVLEAGPLRVPVRMYTAVRPNELRFRMLHDQDHVPVRQVLECPVEGKEVPREHAVRGFEVREDEYVVVSDEELDHCGPVPGRVIAVRQFIDPADADPLSLDKPYYLGPDAGGEREY